MNFVRIWKELDTEEVEKKLLLVEDLYGSCASCKKLGLNYLKDKTCPGCGTTFKYIATTLKNLGEVQKLLNRMKSNQIDLIMIEREDYKKAQAKEGFKDLFKS